jgi:uncharacterized protein
MSTQVFRLTLAHQHLDEAIRRELTRPLPDSIRLLRLKKLKLSVKDRLAALMRRPKG